MHCDVNFIELSQEGYSDTYADSRVETSLTKNSTYRMYQYCLRFVRLLCANKPTMYYLCIAFIVFHLTLSAQSFVSLQ